jgi:CrcB protein
MQSLLAVGLGGFVGAICRYSLTGWMQLRFPAFRPAGTLLVNVLGCLLIGLLMGLVTHKQTTLSEPLRLFLITGILGSLTTFSTFGYETVELLREHELRLAAWNVAANMLLGFTAVFLAVWFSGWLLKPAG